MLVDTKHSCEHNVNTSPVPHGTVCAFIHGHSWKSWQLHHGTCLRVDMKVCAVTEAVSWNTSVI